MRLAWCCRQQQAGIAGAFEAVHDPARFKNAVTSLHRKLGSGGAVSGCAVSGASNSADHGVIAELKAEAER